MTSWIFIYSTVKAPDGSATPVPQDSIEDRGSIVERVPLCVASADCLAL